jgi:hypothetical protein
MTFVEAILGIDNLSHNQLIRKINWCCVSLYTHFPFCHCINTKSPNRIRILISTWAYIVGSVCHTVKSDRFLIFYILVRISPFIKPFLLKNGSPLSVFCFFCSVIVLSTDSEDMMGTSTDDDPGTRYLTPTT